MTKKEQFILKLYELGAIKFGKFTLKSGKISPFYFDLRDMISDPELLHLVVGLLTEKIRNLDFDYVSGIPYTALPIASLVADRLQKPLIYARKEQKSYGTKNPIIGQYQAGKKCLIIDDLITTGESIVETAEKFEAAGLQPRDFIVLIDRSAKGAEQLSKKGYRLHSLVGIEEMLDILLKHQKIEANLANQILDFVKHDASADQTDYTNDLTRRLTQLIHRKKSRLVLSLDVDNQKEFFKILDQTAGHIVMLKTHVDILKDFDTSFPKKLQDYAKRYNFMIFEDRKFADIGHTVRRQYREGIYKIAQWSDFVTVHGIPGEGILQGLFEDMTGKAGFLLAKMSSKGNLMNETYTRSILEMGRQHPENVSGYIGHGQSVEAIRRLKNKMPKGQLLLMPGVKLQPGSDSMGQQYISVKDAIAGGADLIIVGRGILSAAHIKQQAQAYQQASYQL